MNPYKPVTTIEELVPCLECNGKGWYVNIYEPEKGIRACPTCLGDGQIWRPKQPEQPFSFFTLDQLNRAGYSKILCWQCMGNAAGVGSDCSNCISGWVYYPKEYPENRVQEWLTALQKFKTRWKEALIETIQTKVNSLPEPKAVTCWSCNGKGFYTQTNGIEVPCLQCEGKGNLLVYPPEPANWKYPDLSYWENSPYASPTMIRAGGNRGGIKLVNKEPKKQPDLLVPIGQRIPRKFGKL